MNDEHESYGDLPRAERRRIPDSPLSEARERRCLLLLLVLAGLLLLSVGALIINATDEPVEVME